MNTNIMKKFKEINKVNNFYSNNLRKQKNVQLIFLKIMHLFENIKTNH